MITVICGEDSSQSRNYYFELKNQYRKDGFDLLFIRPNELEQVVKGNYDTQSLFSGQRIFLIENLNKFISKRKNIELYELIETISNQKNRKILSWEDGVSARNLKYPKTVTVKEFKLNQSVFKLLDSCYPGNIKLFMATLNEVSVINDEYFIFIMLARHIRNLLILSCGGILAKLQSWQVAKLKKQSFLWDKKNLTEFYDGLYRIDVMNKTNSTSFTLKKSLELLACYYL